MKRISVLLALLSVIVLLGACSQKAAEDRDTGESGGPQYSDEAQADDISGEIGTPQETVRKIIKNASIDMVVQDVREAYKSILDFAKRNGGYEFSQTTGAYGEYITLNAEVKIPADKLDAFTDFIDGCGDVINCEISSSDVTDQYYDAEIRLRTKKASLEQYYKMLENAGAVDDILRIQNEINRLTEEIEALEGKLRLWESQVAESGVKLYIQQKNDPAKIKKNIRWNALSFSDMGTLIANGFSRVVNIIVSALQWAVIAVAAASPLIVVGGAILLVRRVKKKK